MKYLYTIAFLSVSFINSFGQITTANTTAINAVQNVLLGGGVVASNITFTGYVNAIGIFNAPVATSLGITSGVYLTTGSIFQTDPNNAFSTGQDGPAGPSSQFQSIDQSLMGGTGAGDANLNTISSATTYDAAKLEFDFIPQSDTIKFKYTFGSEEYNEWVNMGYNDVFGFFLTGVTTPLATTNIALIPATATIVSINNVNNGNAAGVSAGPCTNCAYYRDNVGGSINVVYDGMTAVLQAKYPVICGETYHIKLAIADAGDHVYDSGVFLEAGSFTATVPITILSDVQFSSNDTVLFEGCGNADIIFIRPIALSALADTFSFIITGTATNGVDYSNINDTIIFPAGQDTLVIPISAFNDGLTEGTENLTITLSQVINICGLVQSVTYTIYIADLLPLTLATQDTFLCNGNGLTLAPTITGGGGTIYYNWTALGATVGTASTLLVSPSTTTSYIFTVSDSCGQGPLVDTITVQVGTANFITVNGDVINDPIDTIVTEGCDTLKITFTRGGINLNVVDVFNYTVGGTATNGTDYSPIITGQVTFPSGSTTQTITVLTPNDGINEGINGETLIIIITPDLTNPCAIQVPQTILIHIIDLMPINAIASDTTICAGTTATINASSTGGGGVISYSWNLGLGNGQVKSVTPLVTTNYIISVSDNCGSAIDTDTATVTVLTSSPQINDILDVAICAGLNASLPTTITGGYGPYGIVWSEFIPTPDSVIILNQQLSQINSVSIGGIFIITVTDQCLKTANDTVVVTIEDCVLNIPNIVTPNGDGVNDFLYFENLDKYPNSVIVVFNRWGNKIMESPNYNNQWVPDAVDGVYYFILTVADGRNFSSYFQVIRPK